MKDSSIFEESRSGDLSDIKRVEAACRRWERDLPEIKRAAFGRYAPQFCFGKSGLNVDLRNFSGSSDEFYVQIGVILSKRFYQAETRRKYLSCLKRFLGWLNVPVNRVTDKCIYAYLYDLFNARLKPATYSLHLSALRTIFDCFCHLDITKKIELPKIGKKVSGGREVVVRGERIRAEFQIEEVEMVMSARNSARDMALFLGLFLLNLKLNELLSLRRKDVFLDKGELIVWPGLGREEQKIELPQILSSFFVERVNELDDGDYLFSSNRSIHKPLTGQGANKIIQKMFHDAGNKRKVNCSMLLNSECGEGIEKLLNKFCKSENSLVSQDKTTVRSVGDLQIVIGELIRYKKVVSADIELTMRCKDGEDITLRGLHVAELSGGAPSIYFPYLTEWKQELLWVSREVKERICSSVFKERISQIMVDKYLNKKESCYIRKKRVNAYWGKTG